MQRFDNLWDINEDQGNKTSTFVLRARKRGCCRPAADSAAFLRLNHHPSSFLRMRTSARKANDHCAVSWNVQAKKTRHQLEAGALRHKWGKRKDCLEVILNLDGPLRYPALWVTSFWLRKSENVFHLKRHANGGASDHQFLMNGHRPLLRLWPREFTFGNVSKSGLRDYITAILWPCSSNPSYLTVILTNSGLCKCSSQPQSTQRHPYRPSFPEVSQIPSPPIIGNTCLSTTLHQRSCPGAFRAHHGLARIGNGHILQLWRSDVQTCSDWMCDRCIPRRMVHSWRWHGPRYWQERAGVQPLQCDFYGSPMSSNDVEHVVLDDRAGDWICRGLWPAGLWIRCGCCGDNGIGGVGKYDFFTRHLDLLVAIRYHVGNSHGHGHFCSFDASHLFWGTLVHLLHSHWLKDAKYQRTRLFANLFRLFAATTD